MIAYERAGTSAGQPLVFVHGWCCDRSHFAPQLAHFASDHPVLALDLPGHGASAPAERYDAESLSAGVLGLTAGLGLVGPVVVGHSFGAMVALGCARLSGDVAAVVLLDPPPLLPGRGKEFFRRSVEEVRADVDGSWRRRFVERLLRADTPGRAGIIEGFAAAPVHVAAEVCRAIADFEPAAVRTPTLLVTAGPAEPELPFAELTVGRVVGAGHFLQLDVAEQVNPMIERFLLLLQ